MKEKMDKKYFVLYLLPTRPDFAQTMTAEEREIMTAHVGYWSQLMNHGKVLAFGPVMDPAEVYGLGIIAVDDEQEVKEFIANDPAARINRYEYFPMRAKVPAKS
jgi:uncharacterized protein YciI